MMRVGIIQPNFIPWRGYFDFIASVDCFIFLDDVQFTRRDWRTRNRIKKPHGSDWLSVPVHYRGRQFTIHETLIDRSQDWEQQHHNIWRANYARTPYFGDVMQVLAALNANYEESIADLDIRLIRAICSYLNIATPLLRARDLSADGRKTDRLLDLVRKIGASIYVSGPSAADYLDMNQFRTAGIGLEYKTYDYLPYPQLWGEFDGAVSVLDLIANLGPEAKRHITSVTPNRRVLDPATPREVHPV